MPTAQMSQALDVMLAKSNDLAELMYRDAKFQEFYKKFQTEHPDATAEEGDAEYERLYNELKLSEVDEEYVTQPSKRYPDHLFQMGYFRSSYGPGGLDLFLKQNFDVTLADIFMVPSETELEFRPEWDKVKENLYETLHRLHKYTGEDASKNTILWYEEAVEIMIETILYVLDQPDKDKFFLAWNP